MANLIMGLSSILCSLNRHYQHSCWLLLGGFLLDLADGAVARQLNACSALGAKMDDFADFTSFGLATALLLQTQGCAGRAAGHRLRAGRLRSPLLLLQRDPLHLPGAALPLRLLAAGEHLPADGRQRHPAACRCHRHDPLHGRPGLLPPLTRCWSLSSGRS
uniref:Transmembrane protein 269 n=1 Tax=Anas platyrhynchos TaxID=8839 RepID=A0A8B9ZEX2_ANAPL